MITPAPPPYVTSLEEVLWGGALVAITMAMHGFGMLLVLRTHGGLKDYTTLGSNYNLHLRWRLLEGMIAVAGLLTFAWSTGVLLTMAQEFQDQQMLQFKQRRDKRQAGHRPVARPAAAASHSSDRAAQGQL